MSRPKNRPFLAELSDCVNFDNAETTRSDSLLGYVRLRIRLSDFRRPGDHERVDTFKEMLWNGQVLWGMMVYDTLSGLDYLLTRPEVDTARVATLGMSMGSTMA